jgi:Peptidase M50B-like
MTRTRWGDLHRRDAIRSDSYASPMASQADRREVLRTVGAAAVVWLVFSSAAPLLPVRWFATLVHEAGHALLVTLVGGDVASVTINEHGGGLTYWTYAGDVSTARVVLVASAGYLGTAILGGVMLELASHVRRGRVAVLVLAALVALIGLAWVPWNTDPGGMEAQVTGSSSDDGRFTTIFCVVTVAVLVVLALVRWERLRRTVVLALATILCFASIDDLRSVLDISSRGGHSDAAIAADVTPLSSWAWSVIWLLVGGIACGLGLWAALGDDDAEKLATRRQDPAPGNAN